MRQETTAKALPFAPRDLILDYALQQHSNMLADPFERAAQQWHVKVSAEAWNLATGDTEHTYEVGWAAVTVLERDPTVNLYEVLDSIDGDHETIGATILDHRTGDLNPALEELLAPIGDILLCDRTWIAPGFRGHDLGLLIK